VSHEPGQLNETLDPRTARLQSQFADALKAVDQAKPFAKALHQTRAQTLTLQLIKEPGGIEALYAYADRFDDAGLFHGSEWADPEKLKAGFVTQGIMQRGGALAVECLSALRFLALAEGRAAHEGVTADQAREFLEEVLALNLHLLSPTEATRIQGGAQLEGVQRLLEFIADRLGTGGVIDATAGEAERLLRQRPILVHPIKKMIRSLSRMLEQRDEDYDHPGATQLIHAVEGPTELARKHSDPAAYAEAIGSLDEDALREQAKVFGSSMWITGLVCPQHAALLTHIKNHHPQMLGEALGVGKVGAVCLELYQSLVHDMIDHAITPATAQAVYGLASMLGSGILFFPPIQSELLRLGRLPLHPTVTQLLETTYHDPAQQPPARTLLLAGVLNTLGQPLGVGQGDNPTCQAARAISLWAQVDPGFLLGLLAQSARDNRIVMHFEGQALTTETLAPAMIQQLHTELDPVSLLLVPHLDKIYGEMSRLVVGRGEDGHKWINPELHGWWIERGFATTIDFATGAVTGFDDFVRLFYATYHLDYRGPAILNYPQPAGIAVTNLFGQRLGWHAITIQRVARDSDGEVRVYFFNPNNDSGQDWGCGVKPSTDGHGEWFGEASLPFEQFAARLYLFHYNPYEHGDPRQVPPEPIDTIRQAVQSSWAADLQWHDTPPAPQPPQV